MGRDEIAKAKFKVIPWAGSFTPIRVFLEVAGRAAHGKAWPDDAAKIVDTKTIPETASRRLVRQMVSEIVSAGIAGTLDARLTAKVEKIRGHDGDQHASTENVIFSVLPSFWASFEFGPSIRWHPSIARVGHKDVKLSPAAGYTGEFLHKGAALNLPEYIEGDMGVYQPQPTLERLFGEMLLPDDAWMKRYSSHRNAFLAELVTVGWRYLAINKPDDHHGIIKKIESVMWEYLITQGIQPDDGAYSDATVNNIASNLHKQWVKGETTTGVLINSVRQAKPKK